MNSENLLELLRGIESGRLTASEGMEKLRHLPFEDLDFVKIDHHRSMRTGLPEIIYAAGKTDDQVRQIFLRMAEKGGNVLATRATPSAAEAVLKALPKAKYHATARAITLRQQETKRPSAGMIAILCAGTSDVPVADEAAVTAELLGHSITRVHDVGVAGIHRLFAQRDVLMEARVIIACAGMEGALPSVVAGLVRAPVIAVPTSVGYGAAFGGVAALLGMLNSCSPNIAVVNIDNGFGAACFANAILSGGAAAA